MEISPADETKTDLPKIETKTDLPKIEADTDLPAGRSQSEGGSGQTPESGMDRGSSTSSSSAGSTSVIPPVKDTSSPGMPGSSQGGANRTTPSQPASSVSTDRAEARGVPVPGGASTPSGPGSHVSGPGDYGSGNSVPGIFGSMNSTPTSPDPAGQNHGNPGTPGGQIPGAAPGHAPSGSGAGGQPSGGTSRFGTGGFTGTLLKNRKPKAQTAAKPAGGKNARKAQLQLARLEPWSVMKFSFVMSLVCFVVLLVAVIVLYAILSWLGVFSAITDTVSDLTRRQGETTGGLDAASWFSFARVFGYTVLVGGLNVLLITALSTVGSVIYNLAADLVGGVEVTLKEAE